MKIVDVKAFWGAVGQRALGASLVTATGVGGPADSWPFHGAGLRRSADQTEMILESPSRVTDNAAPGSAA